MPRRRHAPPGFSHFFPRAHPLPCSLSHAATERHRRRTRCHRGHRPPHASPTRQEAPPRPPLPPRRATHRRKKWSLAIELDPAASAPRLPATVQRPRRLLELAKTVFDPAVSSRTDSPSSPARAHALAPFPTSAETCRRRECRRRCYGGPTLHMSTWSSSCCPVASARALRLL